MNLFFNDGLILNKQYYDYRAYKYDGELSGISLHADTAAVNVNFWITIDEANLDPDSGGLVVYTMEAPMEWDFYSFNDRDRKHEIVSYLTEQNAERVVIPYRQNRMVMFNSNLFHQSDHKGLFEPTQYHHIRINLVRFLMDLCFLCILFSKLNQY